MLIRQVDQAESDWYASQLYAVQDRVLARIDSDSFYLTGGTCLSRCYYHHRYSDDLHFFFLGEKYDAYEFEHEFVRIVSSLGSEFKMTVTVNEKQYKRAFVEEGAVNLKIEFVNEPFPVLGDRVRISSYLIDTKENIAVNKITAVCARKACKDYFDLYFLLQEFSLPELLKLSSNKMVPPSYEELIMSLEKSLWEGQVLTSLEITETQFLSFAAELVEDILAYARQAG